MTLNKVTLLTDNELLNKEIHAKNDAFGYRWTYSVMAWEIIFVLLVATNFALNSHAKGSLGILCAINIGYLFLIALWAGLKFFKLRYGTDLVGLLGMAYCSICVNLTLRDQFLSTPVDLDRLPTFTGMALQIYVLFNLILVTRYQNAVFGILPIYLTGAYFQYLASEQLVQEGRARIADHSFGLTVQRQALLQAVLCLNAYSLQKERTISLINLWVTKRQNKDVQNLLMSQPDGVLVIKPQAGGDCKNLVNKTDVKLSNERLEQLLGVDVARLDDESAQDLASKTVFKPIEILATDQAEI